MTTPNLNAAQQAALAVIGLGPDPREAGFWNTYLAVDAKALAALLDALQVPASAVHGAVLNKAETPAQEGQE